MAIIEADSKRAQEYLGGASLSPDDVLTLSKDLQKGKDFHLARQIL